MEKQQELYNILENRLGTSPYYELNFCLLNRPGSKLNKRLHERMYLRANKRMNHRLEDLLEQVRRGD